VRTKAFGQSHALKMIVTFLMEVVETGLDAIMVPMTIDFGRVVILVARVMKGSMAMTVDLRSTVVSRLA